MSFITAKHCVDVIIIVYKSVKSGTGVFFCKLQSVPFPRPFDHLLGENLNVSGAESGTVVY